ETDVRGGAARPLAGLGQRRVLGVVEARADVEALPHDVATLDDHAAHHRVRRGRPPAVLGQLHRPQQVRLVGRAQVATGAVAARTRSTRSLYAAPGSGAAKIAE